MKHLRPIYLIPTVIVLILGAGLVGIHQHHAPKASVAPVSKVTSTPKTAGKYANAQLYKIGDTVAFKSVNLRVNSITATDHITGPYQSPLYADAGTKFVVVNLTDTNITDSPFVYPEAVLFDQKDRGFDEYNNTIGNIPDYMQGQELSPSVPKTGNIVFQVPNDTTTVRVGGYVGNTTTLKLVEATL